MYYGVVIIVLSGLVAREDVSPVICPVKLLSVKSKQLIVSTV